jgi:hypothetical protein
MGIIMDIRIQKITPDVARTMLDRNTGNRPVDKSVLDRYTMEMKCGRWLNDGAPIRFSKSGRLLDGQHRLSAVCQSGIPIDAVVVCGLDDDAFKTMDTGKARIAADVLGAKGYPHRIAAAAIAAAWFYYTKNGHPGARGGADKITNAIALDIYESNPEIAEAASFRGAHVWIARHIPSMAFGTLYVACAKAGQRIMVREFFSELCSPTRAAINTSVIPLRDKLIENRASKEKMAPAMVAAYVFKSYRDYRDGRAARQLRIVLRDGRLTRDHFKI